MRTLVTALLLVVAALGCQVPPDSICGRVRVLWPFFEIDPSHDISDAPGLQIDLEVRTGFEEGTWVMLLAGPPGGEGATTNLGTTHAEEDGTLRFAGVTLPTGAIELALEAQGECGVFHTSREVFVWDGQGIPGCALQFASEFRRHPESGHSYLGAAADLDPDTPGLQTGVVISAGRSDMEIDLFVLDVESGEETIHEPPVGPDGRVDVALSLTDGGWAIRALCDWPQEDRRSTSASYSFTADLTAPVCSMEQPGALVDESDDLDAMPGNGIQFDLLAALAGAGDIDAGSATFRVNGEEVDEVTVTVSSASAIGEFADDVPSSQSFSFEVRDFAGNRCTDTVSYSE